MNNMVEETLLKEKSLIKLYDWMTDFNGMLTCLELFYA